MANLIGKFFSSGTIRVAVATRRNNGGYEHRLIKERGNVWNIYEPAVERLKKLNIETIEGIYCCYTEPKIASSEYVLRELSIFGKKFAFEKINNLNS